MDPRRLGAKCDECPLREVGKPVFPQPAYHKARGVIIGQSPGRWEEIVGKPFQGDSGTHLENHLASFDFSRSQFHITNALLCKLPKGWKTSDPNTQKALACCYPRLHQELVQLPTRKMIAMGAEAMQATTGKKDQIANWAGAILPGRPDEHEEKTQTIKGKKVVLRGKKILDGFPDWKVVVSLHPAFVLRNQGYYPALHAFIERFLLLVQNKLKPWKWVPLFLDNTAVTKRALRAMLQSPEVAVDTEGGGLNPFISRLLCIGISDEKRSVCVDYEELMRDEELNGLVRAVLKKPNVYQNGAYDIPILSRKHDFELGPFVFDTMYAHSLLAPEMRLRKMGHDLGWMATIEFHGMERWKTEHGIKDDVKGATKYEKMYLKHPRDTREYCAKDANTALLLKKRFKREIESHLHNGRSLYEERHALAKIAMVMRECGEQVDPSKFAYHRKYLRTKITKVETPLLEITKRLGFRSFNPGSNQQLKHLFFEKLGVKPTHFTDEGNPSLSEEALQKLLVHENRMVKDISRLIMERRRWVLYKGVYIDGLPMACKHPTHSKCQADRLHVVQPYLKVEGARSGRWASEDPNMQNIPKPKMEGEKIIAPGLRDLFIARPGYQIVEVDYSALELWILAHRAQDKRLLEWRKQGVDVHKMTVAQLYPDKVKTLDDVTDFQRDMFKRARYCYNYRGSPERMWATMVVDFPEVLLEQVQAAVESLDELHPDIAAFHERTYKEACDKMHVEEPLSGRRKEFYEEVATTEVASYLIQPVGASLINQALIRVAKRTNYEKWMEPNAPHRMLLQVHDALIGESRNPEEFAKILVEEMSAPVMLDGRELSCKVDVKIGPDWGNVKKVKITI